MSRIQELTLKSLDAALSPSEYSELTRLLNASAAAKKEHIGLVELEVALRAQQTIDVVQSTLRQLQKISGSAIQRGVMSKIKTKGKPGWSPATTASGRRNAVSSRTPNAAPARTSVKRRKTADRSIPFGVWAAAAAAAIVLVVALSMSSRRSDTAPTDAVALATLTSAGSGSTVRRGNESIQAKAGMALFNDDRISAAGSASVARFDDGTVLTLEAGATLSFNSPDENAGKALSLSAGTLRASVARQSADKPLVVKTPHAVATVLGTQLTLSLNGDATRLEVSEGRVGFRRLSDGKSVMVASNEFALVENGKEFTARRIGDAPIAATTPAPGRAAPPPATPGEMTVAGYHLVNADTGKLIPQFSPMVDGAVINMADLPAKFSLIVISSPEEVGSIVFDLDGRKKFRVENTLPYSITENWDGNHFLPWAVAPGKHTLTATPFSINNGRGNPGRPLSITFTLVPRK